MPPPEKIVKKLLNLLDAGKKKDRAKCDRISDLLKQLKKQEMIAKDKLANEKDSVKRKRLSTNVKIIHTQRKKAIKRFKELKKKW
ncbi:MAG: CDK5RAP3 family protein [Candidatus Thiodiazotropha sp. (ex Lucinoma aequizonata)]|nr:CDK5RAP3 family protein [Candidatus Thiodiazotropha sp. (ex Lucinoma aequizonata)]MCU7889575.1 CDK5RAP3 family protein [Candidatus Thiodiazotropha sp. (ex Lucinoma aequizonata)]MCU7893898.1 CDK5RAP3 family protein [Candidatus Thiodiazotropha sp. (ex Lucinoma aequizonata)]MCU7900139.1 CDK5RAP3 family protein [Candidatus Thiodiazotropha sp. (ex Lucinoma aequizonata)]MCU7901063.1 CDK5RAP3 family protein [Candidatus Thiodiazotropha sp. (ex Lucinoma aequizonata)]